MIELEIIYNLVHAAARLFRTQTHWPTHVPMYSSIWATCHCQFVSDAYKKVSPMSCDELKRAEIADIGKITITYQQWDGIGRSAFEALCQRVKVMLDEAFVRVQVLQSIFEQLIWMAFDCFGIPVRPVARQKVWKWNSAGSISYHLREIMWWCYKDAFSDDVISFQYINKFTFCLFNDDKKLIWPQTHSLFHDYMRMKPLFSLYRLFFSPAVWWKHLQFKFNWLLPLSFILAVWKGQVDWPHNNLTESRARDRYVVAKRNKDQREPNIYSRV